MSFCPESRSRPRCRADGAGRRVRAGVALLALAGAAAAQQAAPPGGVIYTCTDERGRRLTSDRPIPECLAREQRILNRHGSLRAIVPPALTAEERAAKDARDRREAERRAALADAIRRDRNLLTRFPDEAAHQRAREAALDPVRETMRGSVKRIDELAEQRKPLLQETEFYIGRALPLPLKAKIEANEAAMAAQQAAIQGQEAELDRINRLYDAELSRLRQLWSGAPPGSLGPVAAAEHDASSAKR